MDSFWVSFVLVLLTPLQGRHLIQVLSHFPWGHPSPPIAFVGHPTFILWRMLTLNCGSISQSVQQGKAAYDVATPHQTQAWSFPFPPFSCTMNSIRTLVQAGKKNPMQSNNCIGLLERPAHNSKREKDGRGRGRRSWGSCHCPCSVHALAEEPQAASAPTRCWQENQWDRWKRSHWLPWVLDK